jgi:hypothetical protein
MDGSDFVTDACLTDPMDLSGFGVNDYPAHCAPPTLSADNKDSGGGDSYFQFNNTFGEFRSHQTMPFRSVPEFPLTCIQERKLHRYQILFPGMARRRRPLPHILASRSHRNRNGTRTMC